MDDFVHGVSSNVRRIGVKIEQKLLGLHYDEGVWYGGG